MAEPPTETLMGMVVSLGFWICLLVSATLFGAVALSPKCLSYLRLRHQYDKNQRQLVALEQQAEQLRRVIAAIRNDKYFATELTRIEFDAVRRDEEVLPVDVALKLDARMVSKEPVEIESTAAWYQPIVESLSGDPNLRSGLLAASALLIVISFSLLQPGGAQDVSNETQTGNSIWRSLRNRYVRNVG